MAIRNSAKAIIVKQGMILVNKNLNTMGDMCYGLPNGAIYYDLPGGGQNQYETMEEAVVRECLEETGYTVSIDRLAAVYEEISTNMEFRKCYEPYAHKIHFIFLCRLSGYPVLEVTEKDLDMVGSEWVGIDQIIQMPLYPAIVREKLSSLLTSDSLVYLGSKHV